MGTGRCRRSIDLHSTSLQANKTDEKRMNKEHLTARQLAERFPGKPIEITPTRFRTRSPLRNDRTPSIYISATDDGTVLVKDFGGDGVTEMLSAIGVDIASLFPPRPDQHYVKPTPGRMAALDLVRYLKDDLLLVLAFARMIKRGEKPLETDFIALGKAIDRIHDCLSFGGLK